MTMREAVFSLVWAVNDGLKRESAKVRLSLPREVTRLVRSLESEAGDNCLGKSKRGTNQRPPNERETSR